MSDDGQHPSRRRFLDWIIGLAGMAWLGSVLYPVLRYLRPLPSRGAGGPVTLSEESLADVRGKQGYAVLREAGTRILVLQDPAGELAAYSAICTHEACTVQYLPGEEIIWCACHNGRFALDGSVISGPPPRPLPRYTVSRDEDGNFLVKVGSA